MEVSCLIFYDDMLYPDEYALLQIMCNRYNYGLVEYPFYYLYVDGPINGLSANMLVSIIKKDFKKIIWLEKVRNRRIDILECRRSVYDRLLSRVSEISGGIIVLDI